MSSEVLANSLLSSVLFPDSAVVRKFLDLFTEELTVEQKRNGNITIYIFYL